MSVRVKITKRLRQIGVSSGDLLFCSSDNLNGRIVRFWTWSNWSHVGLILEMNGDLWVLESTTDDTPLPDLIHGKSKGGVQLVKLVDKIEKYRGNVGVRRVNPKFSSKLESRVFNFYRQNQDKGFTKNKFEIIKSWYDGPFGHNEPNTDSYFCSKLVAEALIRIGIINSNVGKSSNEYSQKDFEHFQPNGISKYHYSNKIRIVKRVKNLRNIGSEIKPILKEHRRILSTKLLHNVLKYTSNV